MPSIFTLAASVVAGFAVVLLLPITAAIVTGDGRSAEGMGLTSAAYAFLAAGTILALKAQMRPLSRAQTFTLLVVAWSAMVAVPVPVFMLVERLPLYEAIFEAASAASVLGVSFAPAAETTVAMMIFRATTAWYAGFLTLVALVYVLGPFHVGGLSNRHLRLVLHSKSSGDPRFGRTLAEILIPYASLTALCAVILIVLGVPPFTAMTAGFAALSTNGYLPVSTGGTLFNRTSAEIVLMAFMLIGATSIVWHRMVLSRRWAMLAEHRESYYLIGAPLAIGLAVAIAALVVGDANRIGPIVLNRMFDTVSTLTTAGVVHNPNLGLQVPIMLVIMLAIAGAASYSPGGGLKLYRLGAMIGHSLTEARRLAFPKAVLPAEFGGRRQANRYIRFIWSLFFLYLVSLCLAALVFASLGFELEQSLGLAVGSLSSVAGLVQWSLGAPALAEPDPVVKMVIAATALAGRIEVLAILAAGARADW